MEHYISQLLEDIRAAHQIEEKSALPSASLPGEIDEPEHEMDAYFAEVERYINEEPERCLADHCGLQRAMFPPPDRLSDAQIDSVNTAFRKMLHSWNVIAETPESMPGRLQYPLLIGLLDERLWIDKWSFNHFDFCNYTPSNCRLGMHCACKDFDFAADDEEDRLYNLNAQEREGQDPLEGYPW